MNYTQLFDRWVVLTTLSEKDRGDLLNNLHEEVVSGTQTLGALACSEMGRVLDEAKYEARNVYLEAVAPVVAMAALDGYLLALIEREVNPQIEELASRESTKGLGNKWSTQFQKDQSRSYIDKIDPILVMILQKIQELRVNQALSFHREVIDLPYKVTDQLHQYIGWCVHQGYVLGVMEQELRHG